MFLDPRQIVQPTDWYSVIGTAEDGWWCYCAEFASPSAQPPSSNCATLIKRSARCSTAFSRLISASRTSPPRSYGYVHKAVTFVSGVPTPECRERAIAGVKRRALWRWRPTCALQEAATVLGDETSRRIYQLYQVCRCCSPDRNSLCVMQERARRGGDSLSFVTSPQSLFVDNPLGFMAPILVTLAVLWFISKPPLPDTDDFAPDTDSPAATHED
jgi:hypothetical protein